MDEREKRMKEAGTDDELKIWYLDRLEYEYDEYISVCVIATNEQEAREFASQFRSFRGEYYKDDWLDPEKVEVEKVKKIGKGVVKATILHG